MKKVWILLLVVGILSVAVIALSSHKKDLIDDRLIQDDAQQEVLIPEEETQDVLTEETCRNAGGNWNACGSACREQVTGVSVCVDVCVEYCECTSTDQCPAGLTCQGLVEEVGVCK